MIGKDLMIKGQQLAPQKEKLIRIRSSRLEEGSGKLADQSHAPGEEEGKRAEAEEEGQQRRKMIEAEGSGSGRRVELGEHGKDGGLDGGRRCG